MRATCSSTASTSVITRWCRCASQISLVLQDTVLLEGTLRDNIVCARPGVRDRDVERAARLSLVDEFASRLPDGLDTYVGERGANLSGGQRQRVAIARAIVRDAPIIVLDEPTSALDAASEELIVEALRNLPAGRTRITIAHRLSTVRDADTIIVLQGGRIVETGPHHQLAAAGGLYSRLHQFQSGHAAARRRGQLSPRICGGVGWRDEAVGQERARRRTTTGSSCHGSSSGTPSPDSSH